jgi:hypothetical protein
MGEQRERRLISEWRMTRYPLETHILGSPLGSVQQELVANIGMARAIKMSRPWRLEADCVVATKDKLVIAEAKIFRPRDGVGDLLVYKPLVPKTPELQQYKDLPVELVLVIPWVNEVVREMCAEHKITVDLFAPPWVSDFIEEHSKYWTAEYQAARAEKLRVRTALGVE